jgi:hypothetical protein
MEQTWDKDNNHNQIDEERHPLCGDFLAKARGLPSLGVAYFLLFDSN